MRNGLMLLAAALGVFVYGCSGEDDGDYRYAKNTQPQKQRRNRSDKKPTKTSSGKQPVVAQRPKPRVQPFEVSVTAVVGFGAGPIFSSGFTAERRLPPAIGGASTLALVAKATQLVQSTSDVAQKKPKVREVKVLIPSKTFHKEGDALRVTYDDIDLLKVLNMDPVTADAPELMPDWLKNLNGKKIRIRGFMKPPFRTSGNPGFQMGRDNAVCCFGRAPKLYDLFPVVLKKGTTTRYIANRPFDVVGTFQIKPWVLDDGRIMRIYRIVDAKVIP